MIVQNQLIIKTEPMYFRVKQMISCVEESEYLLKGQRQKEHTSSTNSETPAARCCASSHGPLPEHRLGLRQPGGQSPVQGKSEFMPGP